MISKREFATPCLICLPYSKNVAEERGHKRSSPVENLEFFDPGLDL